MVDTGSVISTIAESFVVSHLKNQAIKDLNDLLRDVTFESATGDTLEFLGYIETTICIPKLEKQKVILLVVKDTSFNSSVPVLIGTNILKHLPQHTTCSGVWKKGINHCRRLYANIGLVYCPKQHVPPNSEMTLDGRATVTKAKFDRTVMCVPVDHDINQKLKIEPVLTVIPAHKDVARFPVKIKNYTDMGIDFNHRLPVYKITSPDEILKSTKLSKRDEDLLSAFEFPNTDHHHLTLLKQLIVHYADVFALEDMELGCCNIAEHEILVDDTTPFKEKYRRIPPSMYSDVREQLESMLKCGVIRESCSPYSSPITVVAKKDGRARICVDYRTLNKRTKKDAKSLPRIEETIDMLKDARIFSSLDLMSGYWQTKLSESSKELTAFTAGPLGFYEFQRLPFGLCNSGATFQRMIEKALHGTIHQDCLAYIDDIVVFSKDETEHINKLGRVFDKLKSHGLKLKPSKCHLFQREITYLGHCISKDGVRKDPEKTSKVDNWPRPSCVRDVRRFLGFSSYFRKYIRDYARIAAPLSSLLQGYSTKHANKRMNKLKEEELWKWTSDCEHAFERIKSLLVEDVTLAFADFDKEFYLEVDACKTGLGAVLYQLDEQKKKRPIAYASRKTSKTEQGYSTHKLEFLGLKWSITDKFKEYLYNGNKCSVFTDNNPLKFLLDKSKIDATSQRWCSELANFNFTVQYKSGVTNNAADALSRLHEDDNQIDEIDDIHVWCQDISTPISSIQQSHVQEVLHEGSTNNHQTVIDAALIANLDQDHPAPVVYKVAAIQSLKMDKDWSATQSEHTHISEAREIILKEHIFSPQQFKRLHPDVKSVLRRRKQLHVVDNVLMLRKTDECNRIVVHRSELPTLMKCYHEAQGHLGEDRTVQIIESRFYWPKMRNDIVDAIQKCNRCTLRKTLPAKNKTAMGHLMTARHPFDIISMDHVSIDHRATGKQKVLTVVDQFTKYAFFIHVTNETAHTTAKKLMSEVFTKYGFCNTIHSDNGPAFVNTVLKELTDVCGMKHTKCLPYTPQGNSMCERLNQTLLNMLGTMHESTKRQWKNQLSALQYAYNTTIHATTGYSPFYLMFGRQPRLVGDVVLNLHPERAYRSEYVKEIRECLKKSYEKCKEAMLKSNIKHKHYYDRNLPILRPLQLGDIVVTRKVIASSKIDDRWNSDPHEVVEIPESDIPVFKVKNLSTKKVISKHRNSLLPLFEPIATDHATKDIKVVNDQPEPDIRMEDDLDTPEEVIISIPIQYPDHMDGQQPEEPPPDPIEDELSELDSDEEPATPPRRSGRNRRPPDRYTPSSYNSVIVFSTKL